MPNGRASVAESLRDLLHGSPREYASHNPAGALMVYALWAALAVTVATGLVMTDGKTPLTVAEDRAAVAAGDWSVLVEDDDDGDHGREGNARKEEGIAGEIHEIAANLMLVLAVLHVLGVVVESRALRRNLVRPMIVGSGGRP